MPHRVFISYNSSDRPFAEEACRALERAGIGCWIAPRDVPAAFFWSNSIVEAIRAAKVLVVILSEKAMRSKHVSREIAGADSEGLPILPIRLDDAPLVGPSQYYLEALHWLDARPAAGGDHLDRLVRRVEAILSFEAPSPIHPAPVDPVEELIATGLEAASAGLGGDPGDGLHLSVNRRDEDGRFSPVVPTAPVPGRTTRDLKRVAPKPASVVLRTGDIIRVEVRSAEAGYLTVFNIGPSGRLNLLLPDDPSGVVEPVPADSLVTVLDVELTPPAGRERLIAVWTRRPFPIRPAELLEISGAEGRADPRATRDIVRVTNSIRTLSDRDLRVVVLSLEHHQD